MPQNAYFLAKIGADTAENEQHFADERAEAPPGPREVRAGAARPRPRAPRHFYENVCQCFSKSYQIQTFVIVP